MCCNKADSSKDETEEKALVILEVVHMWLTVSKNIANKLQMDDM